MGIYIVGLFNRKIVLKIMVIAEQLLKDVLLENLLNFYFFFFEDDISYLFLFLMNDPNNKIF